MNFSVTKNGVPLDPNLYTWDERTKTFSTNENGLVLDFSYMDGVTCKTGSDCTFTTGSYCTFITGSVCTFTTRSNCTFTTGSDCTFDTGFYCTFTTGSHCTFTTGSHCTFTTGSNCTFTTGYSCTFDTGSVCTFSTGFVCTFSTDCTFKTKKNCVVVRRDVFEVIQLLEDDNHIKLNGFGIPGYEKIVSKHTIIIDGKEIEISDESYKNIKKAFLIKKTQQHVKGEQNGKRNE